jgi:predicted enzyme related to lactoylglutathione lyase
MLESTVPRTYPAGVSCWIDLEPQDAESVGAFYRELLGWTLTNAMPPQAPGHYLIATLDGQDVAAIASGVAALGGGGGGWNTYFAVDDADAAAQAVTAAGGTVTVPPSDNPGGRAVACVDPEGAPFRLWQAGRRVGAQAVNSPGAWNFSDLHTGDRDAALRFYRSVFPWQVDDLGRDVDALIRVPGYGDHLQATVDPGIRERQARAGAPPGFADAIGSIHGLAPGESARWHVSFSIADRDAGATAAERLGGAVIATRDMRWARVADLRDPEGNPFSVSQFARRR